MAMKKRFYSVNGQMMGYEEGGVKKDFLTDHLGSITAEIDQSQTRTYDTRYSAYGRNNWSTGTGCGFGWVGSYGYRETGLFHMSHYVRARHYSYVTGGWSTVDPLWPDESAYGYLSGRATYLLDYSGLQGVIKPGPKLIIGPPEPKPLPNIGGPCGKAKTILPIYQFCDAIHSCKKSSWCYKSMTKCFTDNGLTENQAQAKLACLLDKICRGIMPINLACEGATGNVAALGCAYGWCGSTVRSGGTCYVAVCPKADCDPECGGSREWTVIHEITHCCGTTDKNGQADNISECLLDMFRWIGKW